MMFRLVLHITLALAGLVAGCGPEVMETRLASAPQRPDGCELWFRQLNFQDLAPMIGTYELLGEVTLAESGVQDPFQQKYKDIVRPRACAMGGEGVTILDQVASTNPMGAKGTGVTFAVVRKRGTPSAVAPPPPQKF